MSNNNKTSNTSDQNAPSSETNSSWGGRFTESTDAFVADFTASIQFDQRLYKHDIAGSKAHAQMLNKVGILTTYNQACGLATYASYLAHHLDQQEIVILAEAVPEKDITQTDASNVHRCWTRLSSDHSALESAIESNAIGLLHLNCHYRFFDATSFPSLLKRLRARGVVVVAHIHNPYTLDHGLQALVQSVDSVVVHTPENRLEVIANGASKDVVEVVEHGVRCVDQGVAQTAREELGMKADTKAVVCFGFVQPHKGIDEVMHAVQAISTRHPNVALYVVGGVHEEDPSSRDYMQALRNLASSPQLKDRVHFSEGFVSEQTVDQYLCAADAVVMNYRSQYFEASGAVCRALGAGAPTITSTAPPFARLTDTVFHLTSGYPLPLALEQVLFNSQLNACLREGARSWADRYSWANTTRNIIELRKKNKKDRKIFVSCINEEKGAVPMKNCKATCIGCSKCFNVCPPKVSAITMNNNLAFIDSAKCIACGLCISVCPTKAILATFEPPKPKPKPEEKETAEVAK